MARHKRQPSRHAAHALKGAGPGASMSAYQGTSFTDLAMSGWNPHSGSADADLLPDLDALTARSRDLDRNNGVMGGAMQTHRDNIVGAVLRLSAMPDYRLLGWSREQAHAWGNDVEARFRSWAETTECDAARSLNLMGMTIQALGGAMLNGDALALPLWLPRPGHRWSTRLMVMESDRLSTPDSLQYRDDIRGGIEQDIYGAPTAYLRTARQPPKPDRRPSAAPHRPALRDRARGQSACC